MIRIKRRVATFFAIGFALMVQGTAFAASKPATGQQEAQNREIMFDYATCVVKRRHDRAAQAIIANVSNEQISRHYRDLVNGDCLVGAARTQGEVRMEFGGDLYRYALADALVNADLTNTDEIDFSNRSPLTHLEAPPAHYLALGLARAKNNRQREFVQQEFDRQTGIAWLSRYGECVVRAAPGHAKAWLLVRPNAADEGAKIEALKPTFASCMVGDQTFRFNRVTMRGLIAINYYRLARTVPVAAAGN